MLSRKFFVMGGSIWLTLALMLGWKSIADTSSLSSPDVGMPAPSSSASPTSSSSPEPTPSSTPAPTETSTSIASPSPTPVTAIADQSIFIKVPNAILVDPRAKSALIPQLYLTASHTLLVCLDSHQASIAISAPNNSNLQISGDGTEHVAISGSSTDIAQALNAGNGSRAFTAGTGIAHASITLRSIAVTDQTLDKSFCDQADSSNTRTLTFTPLALDLSITKTSVSVK